MVSGKRSYIFGALLVTLHVVSATVVQAQVNSRDTHDHKLFPCLEDGLKSNKFGCLLLSKKELGQFPKGALYWHLNKFPTREAAEAAKGQTGMVVEADDQIWLFSFGPKSVKPKKGKFVANVGPLQLTSDKLPPAKSYEIVAYRAVMPAGTDTRVHIHPGPEAWFILAGEQCLETPAGVMKGRAGEGMYAPAYDADEAEQQRPVDTHRSFHRHTRRRSTVEYSQ